MHAKCIISGRTSNSEINLCVVGVFFAFKGPIYHAYKIDTTTIKYIPLHTSFNAELMQKQVKLKLLTNLINHVYNVCKPNIYITGYHKNGTKRTGSKLNNMKALKGFQLRYIYFLHKDAKQRLTTPILPFSDIEKMGARMYKGVKVSREKQAMDVSNITAAG